MSTHVEDSDMDLYLQFLPLRPLNIVVLEV